MPQIEVTYNQNCRICKNRQLVRIFRFGPQPPANAFLKKSELKKKETSYPLDVYFCQNCHLVQLRDIVSPRILFKNYVYVSSTSPVFVKHFANFASDMNKQFKFNKQSLIIDIGSNDGILLKPYVKQGFRVLGIEPAKNIAKIARKDGIDTISEYFSLKLVRKIRRIYGHADLITATNVFAHINDIDEVAGGVRTLLKKDGVFIIEVPYLVDFLENNLFDTVYHEHLSYFSLSPIVKFFSRFGMRVFDVEKVLTHGGSLRVFVTKKKSSHHLSVNVKNLLNLEKKCKLHHLSTYTSFADRVEKNKLSLMKLLQELKKEGKRIVGYGAPAKGNTLLNYFGITTSELDYIVEDSAYKQGLYTPSTHIPVVLPLHLTKKIPDYILLLAWNFAEAIMKKYTHLRQKGVKFIIPVPKPRII